MASLDSVHQKLYRARHHAEELDAELVEYYKTKPGEWVRSPQGTDEEPIYIYKERVPIPTRFGLIFGDCIQSLRSSLDYLIWELVSVAGNTPDRFNMFPLALTEKGYKDELLKRHRLDGLSDAMKAHVNALQPFHDPQPEVTALAVLDRLAITNRHRRVILTNLTAVAEEPNSPFPRGVETIRAYGKDGALLGEHRYWSYIAVQETAVEHWQTSVLIDVFARYIRDVLLPVFEQFFE